MYLLMCKYSVFWFKEGTSLLPEGCFLLSESVSQSIEKIATCVGLFRAGT